MTARRSIRRREPVNRRSGRRGHSSTVTFNPLTGWTTDPLHGFWASDPLWTPPADAGAVSDWLNGGTVGTPNATQATGSKQPTFVAEHTSFNNKPVVVFATDDVLEADIANLAQPYYVVAVGRTGGAANSERMFGIGTNVANGGGDTAGGAWLGAFNTVLSGGTSDSGSHLFRWTANGASSAVLVDETSQAAGAGGATSMTVLSLGAGVSTVGTNANFLNGIIALILVFNTDPSALAEWPLFKAWVKSYYGLVF